MNIPLNVVESFVDGAGRTIDIEIEDDIVAYHDGKEIGRIVLSVEDIDDNGQVLTGIEALYADVTERYRRAGIGLGMLRVWSSIHGPLAVGNWSPFGENPLLAEGRALMEAGVKRGYVIPEDPNNWVLPDR